MGSLPTKPKHWIKRLGSYCRSYGTSSSPQANAGRVGARPAPPFPAPTEEEGQRDAHTQNQLFILCPRRQRSPRRYRSDRCCCFFFPGFLGISRRFCPVQVPLGCGAPRAVVPGVAGSRAGGRGGRRPAPQPPAVRSASSE